MAICRKCIKLREKKKTKNKKQEKQKRVYGVATDIKKKKKKENTKIWKHNENSRYMHITIYQYQCSLGELNRETTIWSRPTTFFVAKLSKQMLAFCWFLFKILIFNSISNYDTTLTYLDFELFLSLNFFFQQSSCKELIINI